MIPRQKHETIVRYLDSDDILLIIGARQTGKTTLLSSVADHLVHHEQPVTMITLEDPEIKRNLNRHPDNIFQYLTVNKQKTYLLVDEIQYLEDPSNFLKYHYDLSKDTLKIIATGSSAFYIDEKFRDSLAGRKKLIELFPFCFSEFLLARGEADLAHRVSSRPAALEKREWTPPDKRRLLNLWTEYTRYGGYPKVVLADRPDDKKEVLKDLAFSFLKKDIHEAGVRDEDKFYQLVRILASQVGQLVNSNELGNTIGLSQETVKRYLRILRKSYIARLLLPFHRNVRKELTKMPKIYFLDSGLRNFLIRSFPETPKQFADGQLLENQVFCDLVKRGVDSIKFWRTQDRKEVDFIVDDRQAYEVKSTAGQFSAARYAAFGEAYPDVDLSPLVLQDDRYLDVLDVVT